MQRVEPERGAARATSQGFGTWSDGSEHSPPLGLWFVRVHPGGALQDRNLYPHSHSHLEGKKKNLCIPGCCDCCLVVLQHNSLSTEVKDRGVENKTKKQKITLNFISWWWQPHNTGWWVAATLTCGITPYPGTQCLWISEGQAVVSIFFFSKKVIVLTKWTNYHK